jgi:hypothetical protein
MITAKLNEKCVNGTYSKVRVGKIFFDTVPVLNGLKQEDAASTSIFYFF